MKLTLPALAIMATLLASCGPSAEDMLEQRRAELETAVSRAEALEKVAREFAGPLETPAASQKLTFGYGGNARLLHLEDLDRDPETKPRLDVRALETWLSEMRFLLESGMYDTYDAEGMKNAINRHMDVKLVVIVRVTDVQLPKLTEENGVAGAEYVGGAYAADLLLCDLEKGAVIGGWKVAARNSPEVMADASSAAATTLSLFDDLSDRARDAINDTLKPWCEGSVRPIG